MYKYRNKKNWNENLRYEYELNEDSVVFDLGAYIGDFTEGIWDKFKCNVYAFEPVKSLFEDLEVKFAGNNKIRLFNFGLYDRNFKTKVKYIKNSTNIFTKGEEEIEVKDVLDWIKRADLIKINIEGAEYDLLNRILDKGDIKMFTNIQIQYHNCSKMRTSIKRITGRLGKTHSLKWWFPVWESWEIK